MREWKSKGEMGNEWKGGEGKDKENVNERERKEQSEI